MSETEGQPAMSAQSPEPRARAAYGPWSTLALMAATLAVAGATQGGVLALAVDQVAASNPGMRREVLAERLIWDGAVFSSFVILSALLGTAAVALWVRLRKGLPLRRYLALDRFGSWTDWGIGAICLMLLAMAMSLLPMVFDAPDIPEYMIRVYESSEHRPPVLAALLFGVVIAGPVFEEILFRGFVFRGLSGPQPWRTILAILSGSLFWSVVHLQYGAFQILQIFLLGLALGYARWRTGTLWVPIGMHALVNLTAMIGVAS